MDYNTYLIDLGPIPTDTFAALEAFVADNIPTKKSKYFTLGVNDGYLSARTNTEHNGDKQFLGTPPEALLQVCDVFKISRTRLWGYEVARLLKDKVFPEHTDLCNVNNNGVNVTRFHNLHIPIQGSADYLFRRDKRLPFDKCQMTNGHAYLLNNYVWHSVVNNQPVDRINVICQIGDPDWTYKEYVYTQHKIEKGY